MNLISLDIETWGLQKHFLLQPFRAKTKEGGILCGYMYDGEFFYAEPYCCKNAIFCGWNIQFDIAWLLALGHNEFKNAIYLDGMLLLRRIRHDLGKYGLKPTLEKFHDKIKFPRDFPFVSEYSKEIEFKAGRVEDAYSNEEVQLINEYCKRDTIYTYCLIKYLISIASDNDVKQCIKESTVSVALGNTWQTGIPIDRAEICKQEEEINNKLKAYSSTLSSIGLTDKVIASAQQLGSYLQNTLKIKLTAVTKKGNLSVKGDVLHDLWLKSDGNVKKILRLLLMYKNIKTESIKFIRSAKECLEHGDIIYPEPFVSSTDTGRMTYGTTVKVETCKTYKNGNIAKVIKEVKYSLPLHQIKKGKTRKIFTAPRGYKLLELDFAGQELRLIADIANEPTMLEFFREDKDLHAYTAANIYGYSYDEFLKLKDTEPSNYKIMRQLGKVTNFSLQYMAGANRLFARWHVEKDLENKTLKDAEHARRVYLDIYSGIPRFWNEAKRFAKNNGYVKNLAGRKRYIEGWDKENEWKSHAKAVNFPIQSSGAEQKILALYYLNPFILKNDIQLAWDLHDGMFFFVPDCMMLRDLVQEMINIASNLPYEKAWGWKPKISFPVEAKIGDNWGELKEF